MSKQEVCESTVKLLLINTLVVGVIFLVAYLFVNIFELMKAQDNLNKYGFDMFIVTVIIFNINYLFQNRICVTTEQDSFTIKIGKLHPKYILTLQNSKISQRNFLFTRRVIISDDQRRLVLYSSFFVKKDFETLFEPLKI